MAAATWAEAELALHPHVDDRQLESEPARFEFVTEIVPGRGADARDGADPQRHG